MALDALARQLFGTVNQTLMDSASITFNNPSTFTISANIGKPSTYVSDGAGGAVVLGTNDVLVQQSDLVANNAYPPQEGYTFTRPFNGQVYTYILTRPAYRESDSQGTLLRLHAKIQSIL